MAREYSDWGRLIRSIRGNRAGRATFYKPVCVIAAVDLADIGRLDSELLHSKLIIRRFSEYVQVAFPDRASAGWQPLWNLANDGLWIFSKRSKRLNREALKSPPSTENKALERFDTQAIAPEYQTIWESVDQRKVLRDQMLLILARDPESRKLVQTLKDPANLNDPERWPSEQALELYLQEVVGQGDLFQDPVEEAAKPETANATRKALLAFDARSLPATPDVGPNFEVTGEAPIRLVPSASAGSGQPQEDLHQAFAAKCEALEVLSAVSNNRAAHILPALRSLMAALRRPLDPSNGYLIWSHANTLRRLYEAEELAVVSTDPESPPLPDRLRFLLGDLVEQFNAYAVTDHIIGLLDRAKVGPERSQRPLTSLEAGAGLVRAIRAAPGIFEPMAEEVIATTTAAALEATADTSFNAEQAVANAVEIQRSGARAILINALAEVRRVFRQAKPAAKLMTEGAAKQLGAEAVKLLPISTFVAGAQDAIVGLWHGTTGSAAVQELVGLIRNFINLLRG